LGDEGSPTEKGRTSHAEKSAVPGVHLEGKNSGIGGRNGVGGPNLKGTKRGKANGKKKKEWQPPC